MSLAGQSVSYPSMPKIDNAQPTTRSSPWPVRNEKSVWQLNTSCGRKFTPKSKSTAKTVLSA